MDKTKRKNFYPATFWFFVVYGIIGGCCVFWKDEILRWSGLIHLEGTISIAFWLLYLVVALVLSWVAHSYAQRD